MASANKKKKKNGLKNSIPNTSMRALNSAEPNRRNLIIAMLFLLTALISNSYQKQDKSFSRQPASKVEAPKNSMDTLQSLFTRN